MIILRELKPGTLLEFVDEHPEIRTVRDMESGLRTIGALVYGELCVFLGPVEERSEHEGARGAIRIISGTTNLVGRCSFYPEEWIVVKP